MALTYQEVSRILTIIDAAPEQDLDLSLGGLRVAVTSWRQASHRVTTSVTPDQLEATSTGKAAAVLPPSLHEIRARQLGYFHIAPGVEVGSQAQKGELLGTISGPCNVTEAVESPEEGRIADLCLGDGDFVEYAQTLIMLNTIDEGNISGEFAT